jgi:hypothetical protein
MLNSEAHLNILNFFIKNLMVQNEQQLYLYLKIKNQMSAFS